MVRTQRGRWSVLIPTPKKKKKNCWKRERKIVGSTRVVCARLLAVPCGRPSGRRKRKKSEGGERNTRDYLAPYLNSAHRRARACPAYILFHISRREEKKSTENFFRVTFFGRTHGGRVAGQIRNTQASVLMQYGSINKLYYREGSR